MVKQRTINKFGILKTMNKKIIIFDFDGVLFDTGSFAEELILQGHPGMTREMLKKINAGNFYEEIKKYAHLKKPETEEERAQRHIDYAEKKSHAQMFDGIKDLLKDLHSLNYILVLNTTAFNRNCLPLLEKHEIKSLFDFIGTAEISKSKTEKFKIIEEKYNANKSDMLFVTDSLGDVKEAEVAEVPTVAVTWGVHDISFFEKEKHANLIGIVNTVQELSIFIKNNN